jgi:imidazolonepropionase-like amidohydrolase
MSPRRYIRAARVLTSTSQGVIDDGVVAIEGSRIVAVGAAAEFQQEFVREHVDHFPDGTVMPGMIDAHAHLTLPANRLSYEQMFQEPDEMMALVSLRNLQHHLASGVTTIRDNGGRNRVTFVVREALRRGYFFGPRLLLAGRPLTHRRGHFHFCNGEADGEVAIQAAVRELVAEGADHIKIMASGGGTAGTSPSHASYSIHELRVAVETAHGLGRLTTAHCRARQSMHNAVDAGLDCIEHAEFLVPAVHAADRAPLSSSGIEYDSRLTDEILNAGTFVSFTFQAGGYTTLLELRQGAPGAPGQRDHLEAYFDAKRELFGKLLRDGMLPRLVISTDAGPSDTEFGHLEQGLQLAVESGMSPRQALEAVTAVAADACGVSRLVGRLEAGTEADLLAVDGDPLQDIQSIVNVSAVYLAGQRVEGLDRISGGALAPTR